ncbi:MAG: HemK2/MTQ2 family protein methyltransferase [Candidatus Nanoarchaeia archaeon]
MYEPDDDSYLLQEAIEEFFKKEKNRVNIALDMGAGTGIQGISLIEKADEIIFSDINKEFAHYIISEIKKIEEEIKNKNEKIKTKIRIYTGDLFEKIPEEFHKKIDLILFNPPYLPREADEMDDPELTSGESGIETTTKFLEQAKLFLANNGTIFFVASSLANINELEEFMKKENYDFVVDRKQRVFFEEIIIYKAKIK